MGRQLPPLNQLRAFEAAARYESIKQGAAELHVTQAAVSHQIKALEQSLNVQLFHRTTRKITLTDKGRNLARQVTKSLDELDEAVARISKVELSGQLIITVAPFFGNRWLLPRLPLFHKLYPEIEIQPKLSFDYVDLKNSNYHAAVRYGSGKWSGMDCTLIYNDQVGPVCAPQMVKGRQLPLSAEEILELDLASSNRWNEDWSAWIKAADRGLRVPNNIIEYDSRAFMFDAALSGKGVILADPRMTAADEAAGTLVRLNALTVERPQGIYLISVAKNFRDRRLEIFSRWMHSQASEV